MSVKITDNTVKIIFNGQSNTGLALRYMLDAIDEKAHPRTPKREGRLRSDLRKSVRGNRGEITWMKNYAIYQEKKQFKNYTTPGTGPHFAENAVRFVVEHSDAYFKKAKLI